MHKRITAGLVAGALAPLAFALPAHADPTVPSSPNGPHGCALQDVAGSATPVLHSSGTSTIGGNTCTFTQVATDDGTGTQGGSYFATAASWSITTYTIDPVTHAHIVDQNASFSSDKGSAPAGTHVIPVGETADVTVSNGSIIVGTPNGAPGA